MTQENTCKKDSGPRRTRRVKTVSGMFFSLVKEFSFSKSAREYGRHLKKKNTYEEQVLVAVIIETNKTHRKLTMVEFLGLVVVH